MPEPNDPMAEIRATFFMECDELLETAQAGIQAMDDGSAGPDTINAVFRAFHSIKGGAGAFGFDDLVELAHRIETILDAVRSGTYVLDHDGALLLLSSGDILSDVVRAARNKTTFDQTLLDQTMARLEALVCSGEEEEFHADDFQPLKLPLNLDIMEHPEETAGYPGYKIQFRPESRLYSLGNEPLFILRALSQLGNLSASVDWRDVPDLDELNIRNAHLQWTISILGAVERTEIEEIFEFVEGLCHLKIEETEFTDPKNISLAKSPISSVSSRAQDSHGAPLASIQDAAPVLPPEGQSSRLPAASPRSAPQALSQSSPNNAPKIDNATVRVDLERIDRLANLVGELVINQTMLSQSVSEAALGPYSPVANRLEEFQHLTRDIQDCVMMIRAQPVSPLFQRMSRIVRESSIAIGKNVRLITDGETTEVDKIIVERLTDPLTHLVRNAVDHGLETSEERLALGKPAEGLVTLTAAHRSGRVVIRVIDDGRGIDRNRVRQIAIEKGLVPRDTTLSDNEIHNLLFIPGFSTAKEVSSISGRGVGMDVIKKSIQALNGRISVTSTSGIGTSFSVSLPLTLAVLDGMVVRVANETLVIPINTIVETLSLTDESVCSIGPNTNVIQVRGEFVPLVDLGTELGYRQPLANYADAIGLLISLEDGSRAAFIVDSIQEQRQVVIKGLQDRFCQMPGVTAATVLGDGKIALILEPIDITANTNGSEHFNLHPREDVG